MCGIGGIVIEQGSEVSLPNAISNLIASLKHRGPDDDGYFIDSQNSIGLGHTRLAIVDLSSAGHQPMHSSDGRYSLVFNGEIYNHSKLRDVLEAQGHSFHSRSDTEVLLKLFQIHGVDCLSMLEGMFAFAIWDSTDKILFLARDPLGIKPLYFVQNEKGFMFASEIKALLKSGLISKKVDGKALCQYLLFGSLQDPKTLIEGVESVAAGHWITYVNGDVTRGSYWKADHKTPHVTSNCAVQVARDALEDSVARHLESDVPIGVFLSGGIDSTSIVAIMRRLGVPNIKTFSISFDDPKFNEGDDAKRTADHFKTEHFDWRMTEEDGKMLLSSFLSACDSPSIDGFNTFCVAKLASDMKMKVVLSGLGGDEIFSGYRSFEDVPRLTRIHQCLSFLRLSKPLGRVLEKYSRSNGMRRAGACLRTPPSITAAYWAMRGIFTPHEVSLVTQNYTEESQHYDKIISELRWSIGNAPTMRDAVSELEITRYMCNQLLRESDVMSMAWGLELRVPFVDQKLIDKLLTIPSSIRLRAGKKLLIEAVPELPVWTINKPKRGFVFPFAEWAKDALSNQFRELQQSTRVPLDTWYRSWTLMALNNFFETNGIPKPSLVKG